MKRGQQTLTQSAGRNVRDRIKFIQENGDGYITVQPKTCSNLIKGSCKLNPILPDIMGCGRNTMCAFHEMYFAE